MESNLEKINRFSRKELTEEEVYIFPVILCDNDIDRDGEKFTVSALKKLAGLYIGKTGIFSHDPKGENQTARIFDTSVVTDPTRKTADGEVYTCLKANAYMVRTSSNADLIREIDGGIKKEVSVGCAISKQTCSICGRDVRKGPCSHKLGRYYNGRQCYHILDEPTDAFEWSFVAVPAQKGAGVTKKCRADFERHDSGRSIAEELTEELRRDILRLSFLEGDGIPVAMLKEAVMKMDAEELLRMKKAMGNTPSKKSSELESALKKGIGDDRELKNQSFRIA